ncbi:hypothetical protein H70357_13795 [Paenibacillus sp. FSL H7-0357]|uniref:class I SAM-dependent methyltransferase n=1 Tax=unclassified Paenibacillus TaxID=185978 RepID=UPI0004F6E230|nr:class I SAM-dependent methyltransferase [Paenibacillus sp. FSL H7-0357]AIQ17610.1 hypothetical protein H70357_13795 [Paenibacillus sp. FSL H7-0357]
MQEKHLHHARDWEHPDVQHYETTIAAKIPGYPLLYDIMEQLLSAHLGGETPADLLIVGAGGGQELITLGAQHEHWRLTGIDLSTAMLELARQRMQRTELAAEITLQQSTVDELDKNKLFDAATCMLVLHFVKETGQKQRMLEEIHSRLKEGAILVVATLSGDVRSIPGSLPLKAWKKHMLAGGISGQECEWFEHSIGETSFPIPEHELLALLASSGFSGVTRFFSSYLIDGWFAVKQGKEVAK